MKKILFVVILSILSIISFCSVNPPYIQAVCEITKKDGTTIQGYILLGKWGYFSGLWMNGFINYTNSTTYGIQEIFFTMDVKSIVFQERLTVNKHGYKRSSSPREKFIKYIEWEVNPTIFKPPYSKTLKVEGDQSFYYVYPQLVRKYLLSDSITIFHELDQYTYIPTKESNYRYTKVAITDIQKITFLEKEEISNLSELIQMSKKVVDKIFNDPNSSGDFALPIWYHDILDSQKLLKDVNEGISKYTLRK